MLGSNIDIFGGHIQCVAHTYIQHVCNKGDTYIWYVIKQTHKYIRTHVIKRIITNIYVIEGVNTYTYVIKGISTYAVTYYTGLL